MHNHLSWMDGVSIGSIAGAVSGHLPAIATTLAIVWYGIQIWEYFIRSRKHDHPEPPDIGTE